MFLPCLKYATIVLTVLILFPLWSAVNADTDANNQTCSGAAEIKNCTHEHLPWYYEATVGKCQPIGSAYCTEEGNGFRSEEECYTSCQGTATRCHSGKITGDCLAYIPSYYYDSANKTCTRFIYGGCGGNGNRFDTAEECMEVCRGY